MVNKKEKEKWLIPFYGSAWVEGETKEEAQHNLKKQKNITAEYMESRSALWLILISIRDNIGYILSTFVFFAGISSLGNLLYKMNDLFTNSFFFYLNTVGYILLIIFMSRKFYNVFNFNGRYL